MPALPAQPSVITPCSARPSERSPISQVRPLETRPHSTARPLVLAQISTKRISRVGPYSSDYPRTNGPWMLHVGWARKLLGRRNKGTRHRGKIGGSMPDRLPNISFARALFDGADFSGRSFEHATDFTGARFYSPPNFDNVSGASRIDFTGALGLFQRANSFI